MTDDHYEAPNKLTWGKFQRYSTQMLANDVWRIGSIADGSCFFHSILTAINKNYRSINSRSDRIKKVTEVRNAIARKITRTSWEKLQNGEPAHFSLLEKINEYETVVLKVLKKHSRYQASKSRAWILKSIKYDKSYEIFNQVLGDNLIDMNNFSKDCSKSGGGGYIPMSDCGNIFVKCQLKRYVQEIEKKLSKLTKNCESGDIEASVVDYKELLKKFFDKASEAALTKLITYFSDPSEWIGTEYLSFLGNQFNINILIVDGKTGLPYIQGDDSSIKTGRSSIVLLNVDQCHYETLGFEIENQNNKPKIKCRLPWNHPMIQKIVTLGNKSTNTKDDPPEEIVEEVEADTKIESSEESDEVNGEIETKQNTTTIISDREETEFSNSENDSDEEMEEDVSDDNSLGNTSDEDD